MFKYLPNGFKVLIGTHEIQRVYHRRKVVYGIPDLANIIYIEENLNHIPLTELVGISLADTLGGIAINENLPYIPLIESKPTISFTVPTMSIAVESLNAIPYTESVKITLK